MMYNQTNQKELNEFDLQISLKHAFAQLEADDENTSLLKCLEVMIWVAQSKSIQDIATKINKNYNETTNFICECKQKLLEYKPIKNTSIVMSEDLSWIDLLAGKSVPDSNSEIALKTKIFRVALLLHSKKAKDTEEIPYPHILENVLARLQPQSSKNSWLKKLHSLFTKNHTKLIYRPSYVVVMLFIGLLVGLPLFLYLHQPNPSIDPYHSSIISKGGPCLGIIISSEPRSQVNKLKKELKIHTGIMATITPIQNKRIQEGWRLETILPADRSEALTKWLQHYELNELVKNSNELCINVMTNEPN